MPEGHTQLEGLFLGVQRNDPEAWRVFVDRFGPHVASAASRAGLRGGDVDDVLQSTWLQLLRHATAIREPKSLLAWVLTTAERQAWGVRERQARRRALPVEGVPREDSPDSGGDAVDEQVRIEDILAVRGAVQRLGPACRRLIEALFLGAQAPAYGELAERLGVPVGSIGPTRQRCLAKLALDLERAGFGGGPSGGREVAPGD